MHKLLKFEKKTQPLLPKEEYHVRVFRNALIGSLIILLFLLLGVAGYHYTSENFKIGWLQSLLNASMILSGMGPVDEITTTSGKWFASIYALISGVVFITTIGIIIAPIVHRIFHRFHLEESE